MILTGVVFEKLGRTEALKNLTKAKGLPPKLRFSLAIFYKKYIDAVDEYVKQKQVIFEKYANKDENGKVKTKYSEELRMDIFDIPEEHKQDVANEVNNLLEVEIEVQGDKFELSNKLIPEGLLSVDDMVNLDDIIEFKE